MKSVDVPGVAPVFGSANVDLALLALAVPALLALLLGARKEQAFFTAVVVGAVAVLVH